MACPISGTLCATLAQIISIIPDLKTYGGTSTGSLTLTGETLVGETLVIGGKTLTAVAGVAGVDEWSVDGDSFAELDSLLAAINNLIGSLVTIATGAIRTPGELIIDVTSISTGIYSQLPWSTTSPNITLDPTDKLTGGECDLAFFSTTACSMINSSCWGTKTLAAHIYLVGHLIETGNGGDVGALTSRGIDKISEGYTYVANDPSDAVFANTKWGRLYLALWRTIPKIPTVGTGLIARSWPRGGGRWGGGWC